MLYVYNAAFYANGCVFWSSICNINLRPTSLKDTREGENGDITEKEYFCISTHPIVSI